MNASLQTILCKNSGIIFRLFTPKDFDAMLAFIDNLPIHDLLFLPRDTRNSTTSKAWLKAVENRSINTLIALDGTRVIAACSIVRNLRSWSSHVAELSGVVAQDMRGKGIGRTLVQHSFAKAVEDGAEKLIGRIYSDRTDVMAIYESVGFRSEAVLQRHIRDDGGTYRDMVIYSFHVPKLGTEQSGLGFSEIY